MTEVETFTVQIHKIQIHSCICKKKKIVLKEKRTGVTPFRHIDNPSLPLISHNPGLSTMWHLS